MLPMSGIAGVAMGRASRGEASDNESGEAWRCLVKKTRAGFASGPALRTNSFLTDAALRTTHHFTHSNRISRLTNEDKIANPLSPTSHQYW